MRFSPKANSECEALTHGVTLPMVCIWKYTCSMCALCNTLNFVPQRNCSQNIDLDLTIFPTEFEGKMWFGAFSGYP